eukprot:g22268.t1
MEPEASSAPRYEPDCVGRGLGFASRGLSRALGREWSLRPALLPDTSLTASLAGRQSAGRSDAKLGVRPIMELEAYSAPRRSSNGSVIGTPPRHFLQDGFDDRGEGVGRGLSQALGRERSLRPTPLPDAVPMVLGLGLRGLVITSPSSSLSSSSGGLSPLAHAPPTFSLAGAPAMIV